MDKDEKIEALFAKLLLELVHEQSLTGMLDKVAQTVLQRPIVVRVYVWLVAKGDICTACARRRECPDQTRCLHLVVAGIKSSSTAISHEVQPDNPFIRVPIGVDIAGRAAAAGKQMVLGDVDQTPGDFAHMPWIKDEKIRGINATPIVFRGDVLGVICAFGTTNIPEEGKVWARIFADRIAGTIAQARAFDEIKQLKTQLEQQNAYLQEEVFEAKALGSLVGKSAALKHIVSQVDLVAPTDASVLVLGETGTGKELVAHEIHQRSRRKDKPLIRVNCASIPRDLFESEFFGHARGAFTGAIKDRAGRFEVAEGGTLFLDEISEMPVELQGKLLRALQEKTFERVGEDRIRRADVRIIAATNRDLKAEAEAGRFREDLYYRLNVFPINVPPLRERKEDIPLLAQHFAEISSNELRCPRAQLTRAGISQLQGYNWPGNVRELRNVVERAVIIARGKPMLFDLPQTAAKPLTKKNQSIPDEPALEFLTDAEYERLGRDNLLKVLDQAGWKIKGPGGAAELLGTNPATVFSRIRKMKLKRPPH